MAGTETPDGIQDELDAALASALSDALLASDLTGGNPTKGERLQRHRHRILELRAKDRKRWTWEKIAEMITAGGLRVSARTVRLEMAKGTPRQNKPATSTSNGRQSRLGVAQRPALTGGNAPASVAKTEAEPVAKLPTSDGFCHAEEVEN